MSKPAVCCKEAKEGSHQFCRVYRGLSGANLADVYFLAIKVEDVRRRCCKMVIYEVGILIQVSMIQKKITRVSEGI